MALVSPFFHASMFRCLENLRQERRQAGNMSRLFYVNEYGNMTPEVIAVYRFSVYLLKYVWQLQLVKMSQL